MISKGLEDFSNLSYNESMDKGSNKIVQHYDISKRKFAMLKKIRKIASNLLYDQFVQYTLILFFIFIAIMILIFTAEKGSNEKITSFFDVIWFSLVTMTTVGYGDITPVTSAGRIAGIVLLLFGVISFAAISGKVASVLFDRQLKRDRGRIKLKKISKHFIICGWKYGFERILEGILNSNPNLTLDKIVLINTAPAEHIENLRSHAQYKDINYISGDYTQEATLLMANIKSAERVLLLADHSQNFSQLEMDSRTVLATLTIAALNPKIYRVVELIDPGFERHLQVAHCDEIILTSDYERSLLVSASSGIGLSHVLKYLLPEVSGKGLVIDDINKSFIGKQYVDYRRSLSGSNKILIGLLENTGNFYHRRREALDDAQKNPNMSQIVDNLKKIKKLKSNEPVLVPSDDYVIKENTKGIFIYGDYTMGEKLEEETEIYG